MVVQRLTQCSCIPGLYGALTVQGKPLHALKDQRICVVGAGSAGMGVTQMIASGMQKHVSGRHVQSNQPSPRTQFGSAFPILGNMGGQRPPGLGEGLLGQRCSSGAVAGRLHLVTVAEGFIGSWLGRTIGSAEVSACWPSTWMLLPGPGRCIGVAATWAAASGIAQLAKP